MGEAETPKDSSGGKEATKSRSVISLFRAFYNITYKIASIFRKASGRD